MRIQRQKTTLNFRASRRNRTGCVPNVLLLGLILGLLVTGWDWIERQFINPPPLSISGDLRSAYGAFDRADLNTAVTLARQVWEMNPNRSDALILLVRSLVYRSYSDYDRNIDREIALQYTTQAYEQSPQDLDVMLAHAFALQANLQPVVAADLANIVLQNRPDDSFARVVLGLAYGVAGGYDTALQINQNTPITDDWALDVYRARAIHLGDLGRYRDAMETVDLALQENTRLLTLYFERAQYARLQGDADSATAAYFRVIAFDPANIKARLRMCEMSTLLREINNALDYCTQVTEQAPRYPEGWYRLGWEYYLDGNYQLAQQSFNRCTSLQVMQGVPYEERRFECWYYQGQVAEILGDCDSLLHTYEEFLNMATQANLEQTWVYPPEGPATCRANASP